MIQTKNKRTYIENVVIPTLNEEITLGTITAREAYNIIIILDSKELIDAYHKRHEIDHSSFAIG